MHAGEGRGEKRESTNLVCPACQCSCFAVSVSDNVYIIVCARIRDYGSIQIKSFDAERRLWTFRVSTSKSSRLVSFEDLCSKSPQCFEPRCSDCAYCTMCTTSYPPSTSVSLCAERPDHPSIRRAERITSAGVIVHSCKLVCKPLRTSVM